MQDQHGNAAQQQPVDQRLVLIGRGDDRRLQGDVGPQLVFGNQSQVNVQGLFALRQRQHEVTAGQWAVCQRLLVACMGLLDQLVAVKHIQVEVQQIGCEHPQQLFMLARRKLETQP
ncbi:hypothetical protein D9M71_663750 [compost metagenome]